MVHQGDDSLIDPKVYDILHDLLAKIYGFCLQRGMGYGLLRTYGLWCENPCPPSWWTRKAMGYKGLWVIRGMSYEGFDCIYLTKTPSMRRCFSNSSHEADILYPIGPQLRHQTFPKLRSRTKKNRGRIKLVFESALVVGYMSQIPLCINLHPMKIFILVFIPILFNGILAAPIHLGGDASKLPFHVY